MELNVIESCWDGDLRLSSNMLDGHMEVVGGHINVFGKTFNVLIGLEAIMITRGHRNGYHINKLDGLSWR